MPTRRPLLLLHCPVTVNVEPSATVEGEGQTAAAPVEMCPSEAYV